MNSFATAIAGGVLLTLLARRLNIPAITLLLAGAVLFGPEGIGWPDAAKRRRSRILDCAR